MPTYLSPTQTECFNIDYYIPENKESDGFSDMRWERLRKCFPLGKHGHVGESVVCVLYRARRSGSQISFLNAVIIFRHKDIGFLENVGWLS